MLEKVTLYPRSVIAVSGGVDSMVLLDIARALLQPTEFVVAHFNHRTRTETEHKKDEALISEYCKKYSLRLEVGVRGDSSSNSEEALRSDRYSFLQDIKNRFSYNSIITAHHQDDHIETALINLLRGTKWRGLNSIENSNQLQRPFLEVSKSDVVEYAKENGLVWNEDVSNSDENYLRNKIRTILDKNLSSSARKSLTLLVKDQLDVSKNIEENIQPLANAMKSEVGYSSLDLTHIPYSLRTEIMYEILKQQNLEININKTLIFNVLHFVQTGKVGAKMSLGSEHWLIMNNSYRFCFVKKLN